MKNLLLLLLVTLLQIPTLNAASFYTIGMGTSPTGDLVTLRAKKIIEEEVDILIIPSGEMISQEHWGQSLNFSKFSESKGNLFFCPPFYRFGYSNSLTPPPSSDKKAIMAYKGRLALKEMIENKVREGKKIAWLDAGDPMIYGNVFLNEMINPQIAKEIVPSIGALPSASAALQKNPTYGGDTSAAIITMHDWNGRQDINEKLMKAQSNMIIYTMRLDFPSFIEQLKNHYDLETPLAVVFDAGDKSQEEVLTTTLGQFMDDIFLKKQSELEGRNNLLFVGKFVRGSQARPDGLGSSSCCKNKN